MPKQEEAKNPELTRALRVWAKRHNIRPIDMKTAMGWSYNYTWAVMKGRQHFSDEAIGKFIKVFGVESLLEIYKIARISPVGEWEQKTDEPVPT